MMRTREALKGGVEWDYPTPRGRRYQKKKAGTAKRVKRGFWKRVWKIHRRELRCAADV